MRVFHCMVLRWTAGDIGRNGCFAVKNGKEHEESQEHEEYRGDGGSAEVKRNTRDSEILSAAIPDSLNLSNKAAGYR